MITRLGGAVVEHSNNLLMCRPPVFPPTKMDGFDV